MTREVRQQKILDIITERVVETQQEIMEALQQEGFAVTQATVSRDIKELGLSKTSINGGRSRYVKPLDPKMFKLKTIFHQSVLTIEPINNLIVIKTIAGGAGTASALIDEFAHPDIAGCIAGDDTILVICRDAKAVPAIVQEYTQLMD